MSEQQQPQFGIEKIYLKDLSLEIPNAPQVFLERDTPQIEINVHNGASPLEQPGLYEAVLTVTVTAKFKDKTASIALEWVPPHGAQQLLPTRNLATAQVRSTFVLNTPFPPDDSSVGYERGVSISKAWDEATTQAGIEVANYVIARLDRFTRSKPSDTDRATKVEAFCRDFVQAAFRAPLTEEQKQSYVKAHFAEGKDLDTAVKRVVLLALKSPQFLYLGLEEDKANPYAVATRLSYGLWDSLPDKELLKQAAEGKLSTPEQVMLQAQRMLTDARAKAKMQYFLHHWLQMDQVEDIAKDGKLFPGFTPEIIADLRTSLNLFLEDAVWGSSSDYRQLLLSDDLYMNERLAKFYGVPTEAKDNFVKVKLDPAQRSGVVTHPYLLAAFSYQKSTSPIHRGVFLTRKIVGRSLKSPPVAVAFEETKFSPNLSMREKVVQLTKSDNCQTCHAVINPLGFSLELYDAVGRFRTTENGKPVNAASDYMTDDGKTVRLSGARDVAEFAIKSDLALNGFIEQLFHQIVKQQIMAYGPEVMDGLRQSFVESGYNIQKLVVQIATLAALQDSEKNVIARKKT